MSNANVEVVVGSIVPVQFGNASDTYGYRTGVMCKVLAIEDDILRLYLVQEVENEEYLGTCTKFSSRHQEHHETNDVLYCTNARRWGKSAQSWTGINTMEEAVRSLGF